jgi:histone acetyltransferase (RNA polymerase elongator complex component)
VERINPFPTEFVERINPFPTEFAERINPFPTELVEIKPEYVRLYPLLVIKDTELETMYRQGLYKPLTVEEAVDICSLFYKTCESTGIKVIKIGLHSDISPNDIVAGPYHPNIGELVKK